MAASVVSSESESDESSRGRDCVPDGWLFGFVWDVVGGSRCGLLTVSADFGLGVIEEAWYDLRCSPRGFAARVVDGVWNVLLSLSVELAGDVTEFVRCGPFEFLGDRTVDFPRNMASVFAIGVVGAAVSLIGIGDGSDTECANLGLAGGWAR